MPWRGRDDHHLAQPGGGGSGLGRRAPDDAVAGDERGRGAGDREHIVVLGDVSETAERGPALPRIPAFVPGDGRLPAQATKEGMLPGVDENIRVGEVDGAGERCLGHGRASLVPVAETITAT